MSFSYMLRGKEGGGRDSVMEQSKQIQDLNLSPKAKKANWGNDLMFSTYGVSEHYSSSSGLSTPFGSELGSTETDETESEEEEEDEDFIAELTRQMAENMLKDDDEDEEEEEQEVSINHNDEYKVLNFNPNILQIPNTCGLAGNWLNYNSSEICYYQESLSSYVKPMAEYPAADQIKNFNTVLYSSDDLKRPIQVYHLKDQPTTVKQRPNNNNNCKGKRIKGTTTTESTQQQQKTEKNRDQNSFTKKQTVGVHHQIQCNGAGMRAIFLGGSGSLNGSSSSSSSSSAGTGVFLPRRINNSTAKSNEPKKKSGNSTVLVPARVLQALQLHFNHMDVLSQSNTCAVPPTHLPKNDIAKESEVMVSKENHQTSVINDQEMQLPQEWTY